MHVRAINPYTWGDVSKHLQFALFEIDNPLKFDRIFADPLGDFARVQDAMSRTECLLEQGTKTNYELKESCNADALMNYALFNRFCYYREIEVGNTGRRLLRRDLPREWSSSTWNSVLRSGWIRQQCQEFDSDLKLSEDTYPDLTRLLSSLKNLNLRSHDFHGQRFQRSTHRELTDPEAILPPSDLQLDRNGGTVGR